jgi:hypothetical protein
VTVELRDRFNNLLGAEPAAELVLTAEGRGPGTLRTLVEPASPDHPCRVFVKADVEGEYSVSVLMEKRIQVCDSRAKRKPRRSGNPYTHQLRWNPFKLPLRFNHYRVHTLVASRCALRPLRISRPRPVAPMWVLAEARYRLT